MLILGAASTQVQDFALGPVETLKLSMGLETVNKSWFCIVGEDECVKDF